MPTWTSIWARDGSGGPASRPPQHVDQILALPGHVQIRAAEVTVRGESSAPQRAASTARRIFHGDVDGLLTRICVQHAHRVVPRCGDGGGGAIPKHRAKRSSQFPRRSPVTEAVWPDAPSSDRMRRNDPAPQYLAMVRVPPVAKGGHLVTDGPFAETRELLGG